MRTSVRLCLILAGMFVANAGAKLACAEEIDVVVAGQTIYPRDVIASPMVRLERRHVAHQSVAFAIRRIEQAVGKEAKRTIVRGEPLWKNQVGPPIDVRLGQPVDIRFVSGAIVVTAAGTALQSGIRGQSIRIRNNDSGAYVRARVLGPSLVEVQAQ
ncbi:MAG: flagellar basal body P-ring formation protein FlgA [Hyphomicrobiales bacterium]|nr:flagellar basal body P-ring formation protein FlgA [Hyphomicrobiales bacterium]